MTLRVVPPQGVTHFVGAPDQHGCAAPWGRLQELDDEGAVEEREGTCDDGLDRLVKGGECVI